MRLLEMALVKSLLRDDMTEHAASFVGNGHDEGVELKAGRVLAAETAVVAVGIEPNAKVAAHAGIARCPRLCRIRHLQILRRYSKPSTSNPPCCCPALMTGSAPWLPCPRTWRSARQ